MVAVTNDETQADWLAWRGRVETRLTAIETTLPHLATKADLERLRTELHSMMWRLAGLWLAGLVALFAALRWLGN